MKRAMYLSTLLSVATVLVLCSNTRAQERFAVVRESCVYNTATRQYVFNLYFNTEPDFYTTATKPWGVRQHHDFRYRIDFHDPWAPCIDPDSRRITAAHACSTSLLLVTDYTVPFPNSLDTIDFETYPSQNRVSFVVSAELMGAEGAPYYRIEALLYGSINGGHIIFGQASVKTDIALPVEHTTWGRIKEMFHE